MIEIIFFMRKFNLKFFRLKFLNSQKYLNSLKLFSIFLNLFFTMKWLFTMKLLLPWMWTHQWCVIVSMFFFSFYYFYYYILFNYILFKNFITLWWWEDDEMESFYTLEFQGRDLRLNLSVCFFCFTFDPNEFNDS